MIVRGTVHSAKGWLFGRHFVFDTDLDTLYVSLADDSVNESRYFDLGDESLLLDFATDSSVVGIKLDSVLERLGRDNAALSAGDAADLAEDRLRELALRFRVDTGRTISMFPREVHSLQQVGIQESGVISVAPEAVFDKVG